MVLAFLNFQDAALESSMSLTPTKLAHGLREVSLKFIEYSKSAVNSSTSVVDTPGTTAPDSDWKEDEWHQKIHGTYKMSPTWNDCAAQPNPTSFEHTHYPVPNKESFMGHDIQPYGSLYGQPALSSSLKPSSLAYFLEYSIHEHALMCLLSTETSAREILRIFKLSFLYHTVDQISIYLYQSLLGQADGLDAPLRHLGGAGLHYRSPEELEYFSQSLETPSTLSTLERNAKERDITPDMINDLSDFEGEWLDARDVEEYLRQKGVTLDSKTFQAVTDLDKLMSPGPLSSDLAEYLAPKATSSWSYQTPAATATFPHGPFEFEAGQTGSYEQTHTPFATSTKNLAPSTPKSPYIPGYNQKSNSFYFSCDHFGFRSVGSLNPTGMLMPNQRLSPDWPSKAYKNGRKTQVLLDLKIMIESMFQCPIIVLEFLALTVQALKQTAVCLVGCPGFRKYDIDSALKASIIGVSNYG